VAALHADGSVGADPLALVAEDAAFGIDLDTGSAVDAEAVGPADDSDGANLDAEAASFAEAGVNSPGAAPGHLGAKAHKGLSVFF